MNRLHLITLAVVCLIGSTLAGNVDYSINHEELFGIIETQSCQISGKVVDKDTQEPIAYCNISLFSSSIGTSTNELGEFVLTVDSLPAQLVFSHLNYGQQSFEITDGSGIQISLKPLTIDVEEVMVEAAKKNSFTLELAKKAFKKAEKASDINHFSHAFYRQKSKNGEDYSEFLEIFYDIRYSSSGIKDWDIIEGRYALKDNEINNRNFTLFSRILKPLQPNTDELIFPMHPNLEAHYRLKIIDIVQSGNSKIAQIHFEPLQIESTPTFKGEVYIDINTHDISKIKGEVSRDDLNLVQLTTKDGFWKDYAITYDINYRRDSLSRSLLDYIKVDQTFDCYKKDSLQYRTSTTSFLTFYEHYTSPTRKILGGPLRFGKKDWKKLDEIGYNEQFWKNNPIVKRTPKEEDIISSFEKKNAFRSIFFNSAENIALLSANISNDPFIKKLNAKVPLFNKNNLTEKVFLHTDKDLYSAREIIWYSAYVTLGSDHQLSNASSVLHVDLIGPENVILKTQTHELINGRASGSIELPKDIQSGTYQLRSYTQWMRNFSSEFFFTKNIQILNETKKSVGLNNTINEVDVQFFPEGGHLVEGISQRIAFKATGSDGHDSDIMGRVLDASGKQAAVFTTLDRGSGFFHLLPKKDGQYIAVLDNGNRYPLPKVMPTGYALSVENSNYKSIKVRVQATTLLRGKAFYIVAYMNQKKYYQGKFEFKNDDIIRFEIPKTKMPSGVLTITLFDENEKPWCERPVFVNNQEELLIRTRFSEQKFARRSKIALQVNITDTNGNPVPTDFSIAVTDAAQVRKGSGAENILTHILLQSDLKGNISEPGLLFIDKKRATLNALDLVMLTHGWRKFDWPSIWNSDAQERNFNFSKGLIISGMAQKLHGKPLSNKMLRVVAKSDNNLSVFSTPISDKGNFEITDFHSDGKTELVFNAFNASDNQVDLKITLDEKTIIVVPPIPEFSSPLFRLTDKIEEYSTYSSVRTKMDSIYGLTNVTKLDEVIVSAQKIDKEFETPSMTDFPADLTVYAKDKRPLVDIFSLLRGLPGVRLRGAGYNTTVSLRNNADPPLWIFNSTPVSSGGASSNAGPSNLSASIGNTGIQNMGNTGIQNISGLNQSGPNSIYSEVSSSIPDFVHSIDVNSIEKIEVHIGSSAASISGLRGGKGVIIIYTQLHTRGKKSISPRFDIYGHASVREFYSPKYDIKQDVHATPDYRATLYWNPSVITDENGNAIIEFFNSDTANQIQLSIEGMSADGTLGTYLETFRESE